MNKLSRILALAAFSAMAFAAPGRADDVKAGDLVITQAWSRATPGGAKVAGGYLTIENKGTAPDKLIGVSAEIARKVEVHEMATDNGVMKMRPIKGGLEVKPGETVELKPQGLHLMFIGPKKPLKQGDQLKATLQFEKAGNVELDFDVTGMGGPPAGHGMPGMKM
jgi:Uncharacterized protein conserved in bacteria